MKRWSVLAGLIFGFGCGLQAQAVDTTVCDVVKKPASYDGKIVKIKGTVIAGLDEFVIKDAADPNCGFQVNAIWLSYPAGTKGKAGPVAIVQAQPAHNFTGKYTPPTRAAVTLDKSKDFKQFDSLLSQPHQKGADICLGCMRYEVTATLIGRLDGVADASLQRDAGGKITSFGGFGNMNAYPARLVLQSVADITPKEIDYSKNDDASKGEGMMGPPGGGPGGGGSDVTATAAMIAKIDGSMPDSPAKDSALKAAAAYPKQSEQNGVVVSFSTTTEAEAKNDVQGVKDSPDGVLFNCTFNQDRLQGQAFMLAVAHMGDHIAEMRSPAPQNVGAPPIALEGNAVVVTTVTAVVGGIKYFSLPGGYLMWSSAWPAGTRNDQMAAVMKDYLANETLLSQ